MSTAEAIPTAPARPRARRSAGTIAVAVHGIEPATFDRCALIRDWLADHGIERVTLLVIPARDLHPVFDRRPEMASWLHECARSGDAVAQHGFVGDGAEFAGLGRDDTVRAVDAGRRVLKLAGIEPRGFVAPAYAYTAPLREVVSARFDWWAGLLRLHGRAGEDHGHVGLPLRAVSPGLAGLSTRLSGRTLRIDVHPADLTATRRMLALESLLLRAATRTATTYDELAAARGLAAA